MELIEFVVLSTLSRLHSQLVRIQYCGCWYAISSGPPHQLVKQALCLLHSLSAELAEFVLSLNCNLRHRSPSARFHDSSAKLHASSVVSLDTWTHRRQSFVNSRGEAFHCCATASAPSAGINAEYAVNENNRSDVLEPYLGQFTGDARAWSHRLHLHLFLWRTAQLQQILLAMFDTMRGRLSVSTRSGPQRPLTSMNLGR